MIARVSFTEKGKCTTSFYMYLLVYTQLAKGEAENSFNLNDGCKCAFRGGRRNYRYILCSPCSQ